MGIIRKIAQFFLCTALLCTMASCSTASTKSSPVTVIDLTGMTRVQVEEWMADQKIGSSSVVFNQTYSDTVKNGDVVSQSIAAGETLSNTLTVTVSEGPDPAKMGLLDDFTGMSKDEVTDWMTANGIAADRYLFSYAYSDTMLEDKVMSQSIPAGQKIPDDSSLSLVLSQGMDPSAEVAVEDFTGMSYDEIHQWFIDAGFKDVSAVFVASSKVGAGYYVGSNITDNKARRSDHILIKIAADPSKAGVQITVPDMTGWNKEQIKQWCKENDVTATYSTALNETVAAGILVTQSPASGEQMTSGGSAQFIISSGNSVQAINLTSMNTDQINAWGQQNDIKISWLQCWDASAKGTIFWNNPQWGTMKMGDVMKVYTSVGPIPVTDYTGKLKVNFLGWFNSINSQYYGSAGLVYTVVNQESDSPVGTILGQSPNSGYLNPKSTITITVAKARAVPADTRVDVPNLSGHEESDFLSYINNLGMRPGNRTQQYNTNVPAGYVISSASGKYNKGTAIDYAISLGTFTFAPANWIGSNISSLQGTIDSANRLGANMRLNIGYAYGPYPSGQITDCQEPSYGEINVTVSSGPDPNAGIGSGVTVGGGIGSGVSVNG